MFKKFIIVDKYGNFVGVDDYLIVRCVIVNVVMTMLTMTTRMMPEPHELLHLPLLLPSPVALVQPKS